MRVNTDIMNKITTKLLVLALSLCFVVPTTAVLADDTPPALPLVVYGQVNIDNTAAPIGTIITVLNNGQQVADVTTTKVGQYFLKIGADNSGDLLVYQVNNTTATQMECPNPLVTSSLGLDLSITNDSGDSNTSTGSDSGSSGGGGATSSNTTNTTDDSDNTTDDESADNSDNITDDESADDSDETTDDNITDDETTVPTVPAVPTAEAQVLGEKIDVRTEQIIKITNEADIIASHSLDSLLQHNNELRNLDAEQQVSEKYTAMLAKGLVALSNETLDSITNFVAYGTETTARLGAGERAGVLNSYKSAFGKVPQTASEWSDALKIASGRWPTERSLISENKADVAFRKIYLRAPDRTNPYDDAAVTIMAYGLRPDNRNLNSEKSAILSFEAIYHYTPTSATDWDAVRAIAYSGAIR